MSGGTAQIQPQPHPAAQNGTAGFSVAFDVKVGSLPDDKRLSTAGLKLK